MILNNRYEYLQNIVNTRDDILRHFKDSKTMTIKGNHFDENDIIYKWNACCKTNGISK